MSDKMFGPAIDWQNNACLNFTWHKMHGYIQGYKTAGDELVNTVIEKRRDQDLLVFPIAFLYRQYIELQLKDIIQNSRSVLDETGTFPQHHKIDDLWNLSKSLMVKVKINIDPTINDYITEQDVYDISERINEFSQIDHTSFSFRYPKDRNGNENLEGVTHINLRQLRDQMELLYVLLDKYDLVLGLLLEWKSEAYASA